MRLRLLALGGIIGPVAFVAAWAFSGAATSGYSPAEDAISRLAAVGAPTRITMTTGFVVFGIGVIAFGLALRATQSGPAWMAAIGTGASTLGVAATPLGGPLGDTAHAAFAIFGYITLVAIPLLSATPLAQTGRSRWARFAWLAAAVSGVCLLASATGSAHGFWQRAGLAAGDVWIIARAIALCFFTAPMRPVRAESTS